MAQERISIPSTEENESTPPVGQSVNETDMNLFSTQLAQDTQPDQMDLQSQLQTLQERITELEAWKTEVIRMLNPPDTLSLLDQLQFNTTTVTNICAAQTQLANTIQ